MSSSVDSIERPKQSVFYAAKGQIMSDREEQSRQPTMLRSGDIRRGSGESIARRIGLEETQLRQQRLNDSRFLHNRSAETARPHAPQHRTTPQDSATDEAVRCKTRRASDEQASQASQTPPEPSAPTPLPAIARPQTPVDIAQVRDRGVENQITDVWS